MRSSILIFEQALKQAEQARAKLMAEQRLKEEEEENLKKEAIALQKKQVALAALNERKRIAEEERLAILEKENKEEWDRKYFKCERERAIAYMESTVD